MARPKNEFQTIHSEGGLLPSDLLRRVVDPKANLPGTKPEDYGLPQGERLNEAITQSWNRMRRHWAEFRTAAGNLPENEPGTGLTNDKWSVPLLRELGFGLLPTSAGPEIDGRTYAINRFFGSTAVHLIGCGLSLDRRAAGVRGAAATNPHGLVQEFLNRSQGHLWAIVSNGLRFRVLRDNQALSRQSYLEFDLEAMFSGEVFSDFVLLWLMAHATRFAPQGDGPPESCWLEQWTKVAAEEGTRALGDLRAGVEKALHILGEAFVSHPRNTALREALRSEKLSLSDLHGQLLRLVYRLIFLFVAEDRTLDGISLLHPRDDSEAGRQARERYDANYSTARLRELAAKIKGSRHGDLWQQFNLLVGALSGDDRFSAVRQNLALPALGSLLWNPESTSAINASCLRSGDGVELANADFLEALRHLAYTRQGKVLRPVDYKNLGAEELGGVYETLLALTPQISGDGNRFTFAEFAGNERKTSGSYYTPDSLVQCLLDSALDPVVDEALKGKAGTEAEQAILNLKVCDPAVGSGHFLVGAAHRLARHLARVRANAQGESEPSPLLYQHALRDVIGRCLYGIDINPMSAELCRVSLWLEALEPGKPLSFLDHHIQVGNSLLGTTPALLAKGIPDDAFTAIEGDTKARCTELKRKNKRERKDYQQGQGYLIDHPNELGNLATEFARIDAAGDDTPKAVQEKERRYAALVKGGGYQFSHLLADTWCAAFVWTKDDSDVGQLAPTERLFRKVESHGIAGLLPHVRAEVERLRDQYQFFHWHLAFPDVFRLPGKDERPENEPTGWSSGFDVMLGNPPWGSDLTERGAELCKHIFRRVIVRMTDSYIYFTREMFDCVSKTGAFGVVLPDGVLYQTDTQLLRQSLLGDGDIRLIVNAGDVFEGVSRPAALLSASRARTNANVICEDWTRGSQKTCFTVTQRQITQYPGTVFATTSPQAYAILEKILGLPHVALESLVDDDGIQRGVSPDLKDAFLVDDCAIATFSIDLSHLRPVLTGGRDIRRFCAQTNEKRLIYTTRVDQFDSLPGIRAYIDTFTSQITCTEVAQGKHPIYSLHRPRDERIFTKRQKVVGVITEDSIVVAVDDDQRFATDAVYIFATKENVNIHFLVGLLNSEVFSFLYGLYSPEVGRAFAQVKPTVLKNLPIPILQGMGAQVADSIAGIAQTLCGQGEVSGRLLSQLNSLVCDIFQLSDEERAFVSRSMGPAA